MSFLKTALVFCLLLPKTLAAAPFFQVRYSKPLAVYLFVEALSSNGQDGNPFRNLYKNSRFDQPQTRQALAGFDTLERNYVYSFEQYPTFSKIPGQTDALLRRALLLANDLSDFRRHAAGILPNEDFTRLLKTLSLFSPIYDTLIYAPRRQNFEVQLATCREKLNAAVVQDFFQKMSRFHGLHNETLATADTFYAAFYPLPQSNNFQATAFADCSVSALPEKEHDYDLLLSITLHEIAHILYDNEPLALKEIIQAAFRENKQPGAWNAYLLLNEAQATALGNGAAYAALHGGLDTGSWYNNKYRNAMAKAIYPLVVNYLASGKTIDRAFVEEYCRIYTTRFPQWEAEAAHLFTNRFVVANDYENIREIEHYFPATSYSQSAMPFDKETLQKVRATPITKVLLFSPNNAGDLRLAKEVFPELRVALKEKNTGFVRCQMPDHTWLYAFFPGRQSLTEILQKLVVN